MAQSFTYEVRGSYPPFGVELYLAGIVVDSQVHETEGIYSFDNLGSGNYSIIVYDTASGVEEANKNLTTTTTTTTTAAPTTTEAPYNPTISMVLNSSSDVTGLAWKLFDVVFTPPVPVGSTVTVDFEALLQVRELASSGTAIARSYVEILKNGSIYYDVEATGQVSSNSIHTVGPVSTAANAVGGSPKISNGDTLQFRLEASAEMDGVGEATGEVIYVTVPSAAVTPLGTPTITPSVAIQETNQHVIKTDTTNATTTTVAPTTTLPPFNSIMSITETDGNSGGDEEYKAFSITFDPVIPVGYSVDVTIAYDLSTFSTGVGANSSITINKNGSQVLYEAIDENDSDLQDSQVFTVSNGDIGVNPFEVLLDVAVHLTGNLGEEAEANASFEVTVATVSPSGTITIPASQNQQGVTAAGAN